MRDHSQGFDPMELVVVEIDQRRLTPSDQTLANDLARRLRNVVTEKKGKFWANHPVNVDESQTELAIIKHLRKILVNGANDKMKISFKTTQKNFGSDEND
jgi:hypothetical protein